VNVHQLTESLVQFVDMKDPVSQQTLRGREKAAQVLLQDILPAQPVEQATQKVVPRPLGEVLRYVSFTVDHDAVLDEARGVANKGLPQGSTKLPSLQQVYAVLEREVMRGLQHQVGPGDYDLDTISGKSGKGMVRVASSEQLDLGSAHWRQGDILRPNVTHLARVEAGELEDGPKEFLGDGLAAMLKPSRLGLPDDTIDHFQVRMTLREHDGAPIQRVFKGLVMVHPQAHEKLAWNDGYGQPLRNGALDVYQMVRGSEYKPQSRATAQGATYQGIPEWPRFFFSQENVYRLVDDEARLREDRLIAADAPVRALGGQGLQILQARVTKLNVFIGVARMGLPARAFQYIEGLDHLAEIERDEPLFDNKKAFSLEGDPGVGAPGRDLPKFYAPLALKKYFEAQGGVGSEWILNRLPDLSTGQCVIRHKLAGYHPFNAFVVPTWSMKLAGNDFDGDTIKVMPPVERGGLYVAFNDLPVAEQRLRLQHATVDRSVDKGKHVYPNGLWRWAGQLLASLVLGPSDINSRRFIDMGMREQAYRLQPVTQWSVDFQKYALPYPLKGGPDEMPKAPVPEGHTTLTDIMRGVTKGTGSDASMGGYEAQWARYNSRQEALELATMPGVTIHAYGGAPTVRLLQTWATQVYERIELARKQLPNMRARYAGAEPYPVPHVVDGFGARTLDESRLPALPERLLGAVRYLDQAFSTALERGGAIRQGLFNLKDALLDIGHQLGLSEKLAEHASSYTIFREFASVKQLRAFFAGTPHLRVSQLFPLYDEQEAFSLDANFGNQGDPQRVTVVNKRPIYVGMHLFPTGSFRLHRGGDKRFTLHLSDGTVQPLPVSDFQDALLHARAFVNARETGLL
jgi:hypothetical protein